jgi:hypothetical protein
VTLPAGFELDLDVFSGPFDLFVTLVLRDEIDLLDVPIAEVIDSYLRDREADVDSASEFIAMIAVASSRERASPVAQAWRRGACDEPRFAARAPRPRPELQRALERLQQLEDDPSVEVIDVQPVAQLCGGAGYPAWRDGVERAWRRQKGGRLSTASWPRTLAADHVAVLLLPLPAGRVGPAARSARPIADPVFSSGVPLVDSPGTDPVLELLLTWMQNPGKGHTARLAPPVIETLVQGKVAERWVETFGLEWPLPPADGL